MTVHNPVPYLLLRLKMLVTNLLRTSVVDLRVQSWTTPLFCSVQMYSLPAVERWDVLREKKTGTQNKKRGIPLKDGRFTS